MHIEFLEKIPASNPELPSIYFPGCGDDKGIFRVVGGKASKRDLEIHLMALMVDPIYIGEFDPETGRAFFGVVDGNAPQVGSIFGWEDEKENTRRYTLEPHRKGEPVSWNLEFYEGEIEVRSITYLQSDYPNLTFDQIRAVAHSEGEMFTHATGIYQKPVIETGIRPVWSVLKDVSGIRLLGSCQGDPATGAAPSVTFTAPAKVAFEIKEVIAKAMAEAQLEYVWILWGDVQELGKIYWILTTTDRRIPGSPFVLLRDRNRRRIDAESARLAVILDQWVEDRQMIY